MSLDILVSELKSSMKAAQLVVDSDALYSKCAVLCNKYSYSPKELAGLLEAFLINSGNSSLALESMGKFENQVLQNSTQRKKPRYSEESPVVPSANTAKRSILFGTPDFDSKYSQPDSEGFLSQPSPAMNIPSSQPGPTFSQRKDQGKVLLTFNEALEDRGEIEPSSLRPIGFRCRIVPTSKDDESLAFDNVTTRYRYMYTSLEERTKALDKHLLKVQKDMCALVSIDEERDLQPVGVPSQDTVWVCGRICNESVEGRINKSSVLLEGSRRDSGGRRMKIELKDLPSYSLFPGQVVLVEGIASSGRVIAAQRIIEGVPRPLPATPPSKLMEYHHQSTYFQNGQPLKIITAAGPFTTNNNLSYEPLMALLMKIIKSKPDVVVLIGPFVDASQPLLEKGDIVLDEIDDDDNVVGQHSATFEMVFVEKVIRDGFKTMFNSEDIYGSILTQFVLVPSLLDAHHEFVYPQPPFADREQIKCSYFKEPIGTLNIPFSEENDPRKRVHLLPNPCMFRVNEILFGVTSNDVLFGLSSDEASQNVPGPLRLQRLAGHLLHQQSFNPQIPTPVGSLGQVDFRQAHHWQMAQTPDVLIMPSKLTHMIKDVNGTLVINPGMLAKGTSGGTFAEVSVHPMKEDEIRDALIAGKQSIPHRVTTRARATIVKI